MLQTVTSNYHIFSELADQLLNHTLLIAQDKTYRICEIEFYYCGEDHKDLYTHCSDEQQLKCKFYFHKYKTGAYKAGTYKCMDITMSPDNKTYFGILIRSIYDIQENTFIEGPCRSLTELLKQFNCSEVKEFVNNKQLPLDIYDQTYGLFITDTNKLKQEQIYHGPRIGLSDKYPEFQNVKYRYAILISNIKKQRKTFVKCD